MDDFYLLTQCVTYTLLITTTDNANRHIDNSKPTAMLINLLISCFVLNYLFQCWRDMFMLS